MLKYTICGKGNKIKIKNNCIILLLFLIKSLVLHWIGVRYKLIYNNYLYYSRTSQYTNEYDSNKQKPTLIKRLDMKKYSNYCHRMWGYSFQPHKNSNCIIFVYLTKFA